MEITQQLQSGDVTFTTQVWVAIGMWLLVTFTIALALTLFLP